MKRLLVFLIGTFLMVRGVIIIASDQESSVIALQLSEWIKHGNWIALHTDKNVLSAIKGEHLEGLLHCIEHHRMALEVAEELLDEVVRNHVKQMQHHIKDHFLTVLQATSESPETSESESESESDSSSDEEVVTRDDRPLLGLNYQDITSAFILDEREKQENVWFWQRDYNRERALQIVDASRNASVFEHVQSIQSKTQRLAHSAARAHISWEQYYTDEAMAMMQAVMNRTWKKERWEDESGVMRVEYVRRKSDEQSTDLDDQEGLRGIPCAIL